jgi:hypothetical protein
MNAVHHSLATSAGTHAAAKAHVAHIDPEAMRAQIIAELNLEHLSEAEQNDIIEALGDVLLERATSAVMAQVPEDRFAELDDLAEHATDGVLQDKLRELVPHIENVVATAVREGIAEHKRLVEEEMMHADTVDEE